MRSASPSAPSGPPIDAVGIYVPGGLAAYPSSVLMSAVPAKVAGVEPHRHGGADAGRRDQRRRARRRQDRRRHRDLPHRRRAGDRRAGLWHRDHPAGQQDLRPRQRLCRGRQAPGVRHRRHRHDRRARPKSLVIADRSANPAWVAADLLAQAEHGGGAQSILITTDAALGRCRRHRRSSARSPCCRARTSRATAGRSSAPSSSCASLAEAVELANRIASEHVELMLDDPQALLSRRSATPAPSSSATTRPKRSATMSAAPTMCCPPPARPASPRASACSTS